jgi:hypothetical protein
MVSHDSYSRGQAAGRTNSVSPANGHGGAVRSDGEARGGGQADEDLLRRFRVDDDTDAFESLVHRYEQELFSYLRRYCGSAEMAEDVFQATFLQVYLKKENFEDGRRFRPWLYTSPRTKRSTPSVAIVATGW